jgi:Fur family transcriptional regulator, ferric uptake regulator
MLLQMVRTKEGTLKKATGSRGVTLGGAQGLLRAMGKRITEQRLLLLEILQESKGHLDVEELYSRAKRRDPHINLATVYRTRNLLKESGLLEPTFLTQDSRREQFESKPEVEHYHFACLRCGKVIEFESPLVKQLEQEAKRLFAIEITRGRFVLEGYCKDCRGNLE